MSRDRQTAESSSAPGSFRSAAPQSACYAHRPFRNTPKKHLKLQKSLPIIDIAKIQDAEYNNVTVSKLTSSPNVKKKDLAKDNNDPISILSLKTSKRKVCKYFAAKNSCYFGEHCRFLHIRTENSDSNSDSIPSHVGLKPARFIVRPNIIKINRDDIGKEKQLNVRDSEIRYFGRRFRDAKFTNEGSSYFTEFEYKITDPEWVFDVKSIKLQLRIPEHYPCESITVTLNESTLPLPLVKYFNKEVKKFLEEKFMEAEKCNAYVALGKTFIRWLDRNILEFFIEGLRKTKVIIEAEKEGIKLHHASFSDLTNENENNNLEIDQVKRIVCDNDEIMQDRIYDGAEIQLPSRIGIVTEEFNSEQPSKVKFIEVRVFWNDLSGNIATLSVVIMAISIR
ncbi:unnamed protein product, partial [Acanthocheilonema viteae]